MTAAFKANIWYEKNIIMNGNEMNIQIRPKRFFNRSSDKLSLKNSKNDIFPHKLMKYNISGTVNIHKIVVISVYVNYPVYKRLQCI